MKRTGRTGVSGRSGFRMRITVGAVGFALVFAACSSSNAGPAPEPPVTDSSTPATEALETTTTSSTTVAPTTSTTNPPPVVNTVATDSTAPLPDTTAGEPIPAPSNTMFAPTTPEGEVEQATLANLSAFWNCLGQLPNCDPQAATRFAALEYATDNAELIAGWNADGVEIRQLETVEYSVERVEFNNDGTEAIAYTCSFDGSQLVIPSTDTSPEELVDAGNVSARSKYLVVRIGESWSVIAKEEVESVPGQIEGFCL